MTQPKLPLDASLDASKIPKTHLGFLDGLRALAALFVVSTHAFLHINEGDLGFHGVLGGLSALIYIGHYGVDVFIVLSGFCLMLPIARGDGTLRGGALEFFKRRAWRILPSYYAAMLLALALIATVIGHRTGTHWDFALPVARRGIVSHLILLQDAFGDDYKINHVFWSIGVEWRIYFFFPLLVVLWKKIGALPTTLLALVASFVMFHVFARAIGSPMRWHYLGLFALGCLACSVAFDPKWASWRRLPWLWLLGASSALMVAVTEVPFWHGAFMPDYLVDYFVGLWALTLLVYLSLAPHSPLHRFCSAKPLAFLGTFAYSIYLVHAPLQQLFWQVVLRPMQLSPQATFWGLMGATPLILLVCYGFFLVAERPFLSRRHKKVADQIAVQAGVTS